MKNFSEDYLISLSKLEIDEEFNFKKEDFKNLNLSLDFSDLVLLKSRKHIDYSVHSKEAASRFEILSKIEVINFFADKAAYQRLALVLLELLFSSKDFCEIKLTHPKSSIKTLFVSYQKEHHYKMFDLEIEQELKFKSFNYISAPVDKFQALKSSHRWMGLPNEHFPAFHYAFSQKNDAYALDNVKKADQIVLSLNCEGICKLASLFLDMGLEVNTTNQICLESPIQGFGGTRNVSLDVNFWLPGSVAFPDEILENIFSNDDLNSL